MSPKLLALYPFTPDTKLKNEGLIYLVQNPVYFLLNSKYVFTVQWPNHTPRNQSTSTNKQSLYKSISSHIMSLCIL